MSICSYIMDIVEQTENDICEELCEHPQAINLAKSELIPEEQAQQVADLFKILGDTTRVKILQVLSKREMCVCDIANVIDMSQSAVSHQLRLLRTAQLVKYRKEGQNAWYSLSDNHVATLLYQGIEHVQHD